MASSRKNASASLFAALERVLGTPALARDAHLAIAYSGGMDSTVLLHVLRALAPRLRFRLSAIHVHHGMSPNADAWARLCRAQCAKWDVPLKVRRVTVGSARGIGREAAARASRRRVYASERADAIVLAHHLDDQCETVLLRLLRGAGLRGAGGMRALDRVAGKLLVRPFLGIAREVLLDYARENELQWVEDETNSDTGFSRNYVRAEIAPRIAQRFPRWRENLARAADHFSEAEETLQASLRMEDEPTAARLREASPARARLALRDYLLRNGMRAPSSTKLAEMLRQITTASAGAGVSISHERALLRLYRGRLMLVPDAGRSSTQMFAPIAWRGDKIVPIPALGGVLTMKRTRGRGIDPARVGEVGLFVRSRHGGERMQLDARRPRRTLKNLFQEAGVPPWQRESLPLLYCGKDLVWAPGLGVDVAYRANAGSAGIVPEWRVGEKLRRSG